MIIRVKNEPEDSVEKIHTREQLEHIQMCIAYTKAFKAKELQERFDNEEDSTIILPIPRAFTIHNP